MEDDHLNSPIIVNEKYAIIDGQHRFTAQKELELPVRFIIEKGYGLKEVQILNINSKDWNATNFMESFVSQKKKHYIAYKKFHDKYPWNHQIIMALLDGRDNVTAGHLFKLFRNGKFKVKDLKNAHKKCEKIVAVGNVHEEFSRFLFKGRPFVNAMLKCFKHEDYDHNHFLKRLKTQKSKLVKCSTWSDYIDVIQSIYNYRTKYSKRIALNL